MVYADRTVSETVFGTPEHPGVHEELTDWTLVAKSNVDTVPSTHVVRTSR